MKKNSIAILMATFNGEKYLRKQIESIISQTNTDFDLFIRDDGSNDNTLKILKWYDDRYDNIHCLRNTTGSHGQLSNFSYLFDYVNKRNNYQFIMFCDQDDIWFPDKIENSLRVIRSKNNIPALLYTNYIIYDQNNNTKVLAYNYQHSETFEKIFVQNWLMGCTMIMNRKMTEKVSYIPMGTDNHDYWIALVASLDNNIIYLNKPTMIHRLHNNNVTTKSNNGRCLKKIKRIFLILFNQQFRFSKYKMWDNVRNELKKRYYSKHIEGLSRVLEKRRINSVKEAQRLGYQGMNKLSTMAFYMMVFLH